ncbi:carboxypeptidase regulatory-like domain-containing protein [Pseudoxanthomonas putridarboris]|uniref:Carboxypeptidase regulatory-like domain-containing protein n=1 Tax=Pseudoxanthomonas putridarboris TaxID=752605 RepID=A0ABU9IXY9_9GAMM
MNLPALPPLVLAVVLALGVLLAWARLAHWQARAPAAARSARGRMLALFALQPLCALLLYFTLSPPRQAGATGTLVVLTANADTAALPAALRSERRIALPEAPATADVERVPDLATALRRHPDAQRLHVVGAGLEARDADAVGDRALSFTPPPLPRGIVRLDPAVGRVAPGGVFTASGQVEGVAQASVELRDPAGQRIDAAPVDARGVFVLTGTGRLPGPAGFTVQVLDARKKPVESLALPVWTQADPAPRVWVLAGAPNAELKYLRRWATDAGLPLHLQVGLGGGLQLGDAPLPMTADTLQRFDLVVLDERSAAALGENQRAALAAAVRDGLGLMLRVTGPVPQNTRRLLGFQLQASGEDAGFRLLRPAPDDDAWRARRGSGTADAPLDADAVTGGLPALTRRTTSAQADDALPLLRDADGNALAQWRAEGRGRVAVWMPVDTYRLVLSGHPERHGELWSQAFATLARGSGSPPPRLPADAREQQRVSLCGVPAEARVVAPDGHATRLLPDPATGSDRCAAYWPRQPGWHRLEWGDAGWPFHVRAQDEAPGLRAAALRERTLRLVGEAKAASPDRAQVEAGPRGPAWPWFLGWLAAAGLLWWLERSRRGRIAAT